jgi:hypothetical protein
MVSATKELTIQVKKDYNQASSEHHPRPELETRSRAVIFSMHRKAHPGIELGPECNWRTQKKWCCQGLYFAEWHPPLFLTSS